MFSKQTTLKNNFNKSQIETLKLKKSRFLQHLIKYS